MLPLAAGRRRRGIAVGRESAWLSKGTLRNGGKLSDASRLDLVEFTPIAGPYEPLKGEPESSKEAVTPFQEAGNNSGKLPTVIPPRLNPLHFNP